MPRWLQSDAEHAALSQELLYRPNVDLFGRAPSTQAGTNAMAALLAAQFAAQPEGGWLLPYAAQTITLDEVAAREVKSGALPEPPQDIRVAFRIRFTIGDNEQQQAITGGQQSGSGQFNDAATLASRGERMDGTGACHCLRAWGSVRGSRIHAQGACDSSPVINLGFVDTDELPFLMPPRQRCLRYLLTYPNETATGCATGLLLAGWRTVAGDAARYAAGGGAGGGGDFARSYGTSGVCTASPQR